jgi:hypothetical protein
VVWGKPLPEAPAGKGNGATTAPVSPLRVLAAAALVGVVIWLLVSVAGLGPSWGVVLLAAAGTAAGVRLAHAARRVVVVTLVVVAMTGLGWIELVNVVQYGTLALTGPPPLVRWCGATYRPSGVVTAAPSTGIGPRYTKILRTPSGHDVFGVTLQGHHACGRPGAVFVSVGPGRFAAYDP